MQTRIIDLKLVHVVKKGNTKTLCFKNTEDVLKYKWMHPIEAYRKKLIVHNKKDMPTCPNCVEILKLMKIEIEENYDRKRIQ